MAINNTMDPVANPQGGQLSLPPPDNGARRGMSVPVFQPKNVENASLEKAIRQTALTKKILVDAFFAANMKYFGRPDPKRNKVMPGQAGTTAANNANALGKKEKPNPDDVVIRKGFSKLIKSKWFEKAGEGIKAFASKAGNILLDLLKFFLFLAFFDPNGTLISSLIGIFAKIFTFIIVLIAKLLPTAIALMWKTIGIIGDALANAMPILVKAFMGMVDKILPNSKWGTAFKLAIQGVGAVLGFVAKHLQVFAAILGAVIIAIKLYTLYQKIQWAWEQTTWIRRRILWGYLKAQQLAGIALEYTGIAVRWLAVGATTAWNAALLPLIIAIWGAIAPLLPFIIAAAALAAVFYLVWKYANVIVGFFEGIYNYFKKLSIVGKILMIALGLLIWPITSIGIAIYGLAKLFQWMKKADWGAIWNSIKKFFSGLGTMFVKGFNYVIGFLKEWGLTLLLMILTPFIGIPFAIYKLIKHFDLITKFFNTEFGQRIKKAWGKIANYFKFDLIVNTVAGVVKKITDLLDFSKMFKKLSFEGITDAIANQFKSVTDKIQVFIDDLLKHISDNPLVRGVSSLFGGATKGEKNIRESSALKGVEESKRTELSKLAREAVEAQGTSKAVEKEAALKTVAGNDEFAKELIQLYKANDNTEEIKKTNDILRAGFSKDAINKITPREQDKIK